MSEIPCPACARMSRNRVRCPATRPTEQVREQLDQSDHCDVTQSLAHATSQTSTCVGFGSLHSLDDTTLCQHKTIACFTVSRKRTKETDQTPRTTPYAITPFFAAIRGSVRVRTPPPRWSDRVRSKS